MEILAAIETWLTNEATKNAIEVIQSLVFVSATIFTARWTYKTFAHKERMEELKTLKKAIETHHTLIQIHCAQVRESEEFTDEMIDERKNLGQQHNKILMLNRTNFYHRPSFREDIQNIVGSWLIKENIDRMMNWHTPESDRTARWREFNEEYEKAMSLIDREAARYIA